MYWRTAWRRNHITSHSEALGQPDNANGNYGSNKQKGREAEVAVAGNALIFLFPAHGPLLSVGIAGRLLWTAAV